MREADVEAIDICRDCAGIWIDWHDGELTDVLKRAREGPRLPEDEQTASPAPPQGSTIVPLCPRCRRPLHNERYREDGPAILRCGECVGAFIPRASAAALASLRLPDEGDQEGEAGLFRKLIERVRAALGL